jgi:hypothetical protein|nr:MAG TPA: protein of unknown function (DUF5055) [Caudoviricetes sp.]DAT94862.1 MAG TPA: protein of unknown function (DUF5055) [Caudoviricetes sp.]
MAKQLCIKYNDKEYTLEYTRKSIELMERRGFKISDIQDKPVTTLPALFAGAFLAHHKFVKPEVINEIFTKLTNKDELINKLAEMYNEPIIAMLGDTEDSEGNLNWEPSW